jgi:hypothetical protein
VENLLPARVKTSYDFQPGQYLSPVGEILHVHLGQLFLSLAPGYLLGTDSTGFAIDSSHEVHSNLLGSRFVSYPGAGVWQPEQMALLIF